MTTKPKLVKAEPTDSERLAKATSDLADARQAIKDAAELVTKIVAAVPQSHVHFTSGPCWMCEAGKFMEAAQVMQKRLAEYN